MNKLQDLEFNSFFAKEEFDYEMNINDDDTVADVIYNYLIGTNHTIHLNKKDILSPDIMKYYKDKLSKQVSKGAPIDFFLTTFSPKFKVEEQTNFWIYPDMSDLFTFVHLQKIAKTIRNVYPYNFRFIIIFKGDSFKNLGFWTESEMEKSFNYLKKMNKIAEEITKVKNSIVLMRWDDFFGPYATLFKDSLYRKAEHYYDLWLEKEEPYYSQIEAWKKDFGRYLHSQHKDPFYVEFFTKEACKIRALNNLIFKDGELLRLIDENNPNLLIAHTKKESKFFSINLNPKFRTDSHFYLTTLKEGKWGFDKWKIIKNENYKPIYFDGFEHPIYFELR